MIFKPRKSQNENLGCDCERRREKMRAKERKNERTGEDKRL